jgi:hypothetical protein
MTNVLVYDMLDNHCMESEMNDRIKEFKESARPEIDWAARYHVELNNGEKEKWMNEWFEKFAELIVQECISIAQDRAAFDWAAPNDVNHIISEIKEHFGVEE